MTTSTIHEGAVFAGRYRVIRPIAKGGMGAVYEVEHLETERRRALKVMLPDLVANDDLERRFRQEARVAAKVDSAFIVDVFDAGVDAETKMPFLVMELLRGEELGKRIARTGRCSFEEAVGYLWQTALALDKTHKANIVHRDLKPENLFLAEYDDGPPRIKVLDFGIAKLIVEHGTEVNATQSIGTPLYMAPEQFRSGGKVSPATDMFSLGMMAFTLIVGVPYWQEEKQAQRNVFAFVGAVLAGPTESAVARAARHGVVLSQAFDAWFSRATATNPQNRFASATEAIDALASALHVNTPAMGAPVQTIVPPSVPPAPDKPLVPTSTMLLSPSEVRSPSEPKMQATDAGLSTGQTGAVHTHAVVQSSAAAHRRQGFLIAGVAFAVVALGVVAMLLVSARGASTASRGSVVDSATRFAPVVIAWSTPSVSATTVDMAPNPSAQPIAVLVPSAQPLGPEQPRTTASTEGTNAKSAAPSALPTTQPATVPSAAVLPTSPADTVQRAPTAPPVPGQLNEEKLRKGIEGKVWSGNASEQEIKLLIAVCKHQRDIACRDRAYAMLRQKQRASPSGSY